VPDNEELRRTRHSVLQRLVRAVVKADGKRLVLDHTLGLCSAICTHSEPETKWDTDLVDALTTAADHYLNTQQWSDGHFLLKGHLTFFINRFAHKADSQASTGN